MLGRGPQKITGRLLVAGSQDHGCIGSGGNIFLEPATDMHELRKTLHREEECRVGSACGLQDLRKVAVPKRSKLIENDAEEWLICAPAPLVAFVSFAHD